MRTGWWLGWSWAALALALSACADDRYQLVLVYPDDPARTRAAGIEVVFGASTSCEKLDQYTGPPDLSCRVDAPCDPEPLAYGRIGTLARVRDQGCLVYLAGCTEQRVDLWSSATIRIALAAQSGSGCAANERCSSGLCQENGEPIDAGPIDAGPSDRGSSDS